MGTDRKSEKNHVKQISTLKQIILATLGACSAIQCHLCCIIWRKTIEIGHQHNLLKTRLK